MRCLSPGGAEQEDHHGAATLVETCCRTQLHTLSVTTVCGVLAVADALAPVIDGLRGHAIEFAARHFEAVLRADGDAFSRLSVDSLSDILRSASLDCEEKLVFDALMQWAGWRRTVCCGQEPPSGSADHGTPALEQELEKLLPLVRFPVMSDAELDAVTRHELGKRSALLRELLTEASEARRSVAAGGSSPGSSSKAAATVRADRRFKALSLAEAAGDRPSNGERCAKVR